MSHTNKDLAEFGTFLSSTDPFTKLKEWVERVGYRLVDVLRHFDRDQSLTISREEFKQGIEVSHTLHLSYILLLTDNNSQSVISHVLAVVIVEQEV